MNISEIISKIEELEIRVARLEQLARSSSKKEA